MADLVSLTDYKEYEKKTDAKDDDRLLVLVSSVSQMVKSYCGRAFVDYYSTDKTEYFSIPTDTFNSIFVEETPIVSVTSIKERPSLSAGWVTLVSDGTGGKYEFILEEDIGKIIRTSDTGFAYWPKGPKRVEVVYKGGYSSIPVDLKLAVFDIISYYHKREYIPRQTVQGTTRDRNTSASVDGQAAFPDHITRVLDLYKQ